MGKVLIAIVYFVPRHEQDLLSQKEKKKGRNKALQPNFLGGQRRAVYSGP